MTGLPRRPPELTIHSGTPTALYNGMISPLIPFGIRGAIWYQGESNRDEALLYHQLFPAMIADWRHRWGEGDFPFYYVQIAPYGYNNDRGEAAELREAQMLTLATPNTGMAVTMDIGDPTNIHPQHKDEVGRRLALWALAKIYGKKDLACSGPIYKSMAVDGKQIRITFDFAAGGLVARGGGALTHFVIAGADRKFVPAKAVIESDKVVVSSEAVPAPVAVRYAWGAADMPNLANAEGLPASSFRTDDWQDAK
jgi:sialate O-acetylesterase